MSDVPTDAATGAATDVHVRCLTPDLAASTYRMLKASQLSPVLLVGSLVVVPTDGSDEAVERVRAAVRDTRLVSTSGIVGVQDTPEYLRALAVPR